MLGLDPVALVDPEEPTLPCVAAPDSDRMFVEPVSRRFLYVVPSESELGVRELVADPVEWDPNLAEPTWPSHLDGRANDPVVATPGCSDGVLGTFLIPPGGGELVYSCFAGGMGRWYRGAEETPLEPVEAFYIALGRDGYRLGRHINTSAMFDQDGNVIPLTGEPITIDGDDVARSYGEGFWLVRADAADGVLRFVRWEITLDGVATVATRYTAVDERYVPGHWRIAANGDLYAIARDPESYPERIGLVLRIPPEPDPIEVVYREDGPSADDPYFVRQESARTAYLVTGP